ncbi:GGDEF domain-containing protein [Candidatus Soleaferrea massiliensis]|uniref:GGDEF domain-containing protein n=1 Tax=Candidatus Soleaferrea massiliensis TaxID=1470354 RepID=UPI000693AE1D|nr:GGDEF domain-containing protein [Candidatus Soleaferrea massiliensis]
MKRITAFIKKTKSKSADYFSEYQQDIAGNNAIMLKKANILYIALLSVYTVVSALIFRNTMLLMIYMVFIICAAAFLLVQDRMIRRYHHSFAITQALCMDFIMMVMAFVIVISVLPFPERPAIFFPILYLVMTVLFIFPIWQTAILLTGVEAVFLLCVYLFKTPGCISYDVFASVTAWGLGFVFSYLVLDLRLRENDVRRELERISVMDETTGLFNRRSFNQYITRTYAHCRENSLPIAFFMMDIDHFKAYNDLYGHPAGDECLTALGRALRAAFQPEDAYICRYGGEEFVLILAGDQVRDVAGTARAITECVRGCGIEHSGSKTNCVTISVGVAQETPAARESYMHLIRQADAALYHAKENGRNQAAFYEEGMGLK